MLTAAQILLAAYLKFNNEPEVADWLSGPGPFYKAICRVNEKEFEKAKGCEDHVVITESALEGQEVPIIGVKMFNIYFLSIHKKYVEMILTGSKQWEFRQNPTFGSSLEPGDLLFLVSTFEAVSEISCLCKVINILRGEEVLDGFGDYETGRWREAGCEDDTERDWDFFSSNILHQYPTAIKLVSYPVSPSIDLSWVKHTSSRKSWKGIGLTPLKHLERYMVGVEPAVRFFDKVAALVISE